MRPSHRGMRESSSQLLRTSTFHCLSLVLKSRSHRESAKLISSSGFLCNANWIFLYSDVKHLCIMCIDQLQSSKTRLVTGNDQPLWCESRGLKNDLEKGTDPSRGPLPSRLPPLQGPLNRVRWIRVGPRASTHARSRADGRLVCRRRAHSAVLAPPMAFDAPMPNRACCVQGSPVRSSPAGPGEAAHQCGQSKWNGSSGCAGSGNAAPAGSTEAEAADALWTRVDGSMGSAASWLREALACGGRERSRSE